MKKNASIKLLIILLSSLLAVLGCVNYMENGNKSIQNYSEVIKGDWITDSFKDDWKERNLVFTFQDSICSYILPFGAFSKYEIRFDTLIINERKENRRNKIINNGKKYYFKILSLNDENLTITSINNETKKLFEYWENENFDTIKLSRIKTKIDLEIERIGFFSTGCFGICPSMYLEIDSIGNILFNGKSFTEIEGLYSGKISTTELELIYEKVKNIEIDSLKPNYIAPWTDSQTCGIKIKSKNGEFESSAYGNNKEPIELRILFHKLIEIYKVAELKQDSLVSKKIVFKNFQFSGYPLPPPEIK